MANPVALKASAQKVQDALTSLGVEVQVSQMPATTRTAAEAAAAIGCSVEQIVKSLVFRGAITGKPYLVLAGGANRVDERSLAALIGEPIEKARPDFVREATGFAIGGVAPVGLATDISTWFDCGLLRHDVVWAAAGTPESVFPIDPRKLMEITDATEF
jgi:prolyl-tRNA editing enzyme YbaK/EbsC (Cys-tRNA(Pro) deacylase)